jgi:class 3 adenylate cyclase/tetratricopeptide (TPR) repeat protein
MSGSERSLATVLFTDIVGSTERAAELRDAAWRDLRQHHDRCVRQELKRFGGHEINTAGDSFLATFESPARAIACASAIRKAVRELGLEIRAGLHMGEVEGVGRELGGLALHIGARVAAEAGPGEILVSRAVHDTLAGSAFDFEDRGVRALKGVPGEWRLFAVTGITAEAEAALPGRWRRTIRQPALWAAAVAGVLLLGVAGLYVTRRDGPALTPEEILAADAAPGIAVLPLSVSGEGLDVWREGMADLLSTNLDGVGGLRTISRLTVLARWGERVEGNANPDLATALAVAGDTGARYAVVGTAVAIGREIRLTADVFDVRSQKRLGSTRVQGPIEDVWTLVDRFSIEIVKAILGTKEDVPKIRGLAAVTTDSLSALKAYLEGQQLYRQANFPAAARRYARAVEIDSTFAMADLELRRVCGWIMGELEACEGAGNRVVQFADRLPEREAAYARIPPAALEQFDLLRANVRRYPDDPQAWFWLGEAYFHLGKQALVEASPDSAFRAFVRSVEVAPGAAPLEAYLHLLDLAWGAADSSQIERWLDAAGPYAPGNNWLRGHRLALVLAFGDSAAAARARLVIRASDFESAEAATGALGHPRFLPLGTELYEELLARDDIDDRRWYVEFPTVVRLLNAGRLRSALAHLDGPLRPGPRASVAYELHRVGMTLPADGVRKWLSVDGGETCFQCFFYAGAYAADQGNWSDHRRAVEELRRLGRLEHAAERFGAQAGGGPADSIVARLHRDAARALEGYALWKQGRTGEGEQILEAQQRRIIDWSYQANFVNWTIRGWLGEIAVESGHWADAARYFQSLRPVAIPVPNAYTAYALGQVYTELGEPEKARESYEYALLSWRDADPELQPRVEAAREGLARLPKPLRRERP